MSLKTILAITLSIAGTLIGLPTCAQAASTGPAEKLAVQYSALAGSRENADSLITGLRSGKNIVLVAPAGGANPASPPVTFTPPTGKLGYGNVNIALALAKADLARQGITNPTPEQLAAALNGGTITTAKGTITMAGILAQRQSGLGWGEIANAMGVKLGTLISASKTDKAGRKSASVGKIKTGSNSGSHGKADWTHANNAGGNGNSGSSSHGGGNGGGGGGGHGK